MSTEPGAQRYEVEITVSGADPKDTATIHREYRPVNATSAQAASDELWGGIKDETLSRLDPVNEQR